MQITPQMRAAALAQVGSRRAVVIAERADHATWRPLVADAERRFGSDIHLVTPQSLGGAPAKLDISGAVVVVDALTEGVNAASVGFPRELIVLGTAPGPQQPARVHRVSATPDVTTMTL